MTIRSNSHSLAAALVASLLLSCPAAAMRDVPPVINTSSVTRSISTQADWYFEDESDVRDDSADSTANGPFVRQMRSDISYIQGSKSSGTAKHNSTISPFQIKGEAHCRSDATGPSTDFLVTGAANTAGFEATFTIPVNTTATFSSRIEATSSGGGISMGGFHSAWIEFTGTRVDGTSFRFNTYRGNNLNNGPDEYFEVIEIKANTEIVLEWNVTATAREAYPGDEFAEAEIEFELNLGDTDGDGLLDAWETDGIDINFDGVPEIDLPAMGADPMKKNLFLELDSMSGVPVDATAISMVEQAFANAPGSMVDNPDGTDGVLLFVLVDDDTLPNRPYTYTDWPPNFDIDKAAFYGTEPLRAHPDWQEKIKPAYELIFRYCIWVDQLVNDEGALAGLSEFPGDDFIIGAFAINERYSGEHEHLRTNGFAGTFMHEFGHSLNLHHGGQDYKNFKPNYLSVMNYAYVFPFRGQTVEGTPRSIAWELDFSRTALKALDEKALQEDEGLDGPAGRLILFNTAPGNDKPVIELANADAAEIDWNLSGEPIENDPVAVNISRLGLSPDPLDDALESYTDWDKLWYPLSGSGDFGDGPHLSASLTEPFEMTVFEAIDSYEAYDRTASDCPADLNGDGVADQGDIQSFITLFLVQDLAVDFNGDGIVDLGDIQGFIAEFLEGC